MELPDVYKLNLKTDAQDRAELIAYCLNRSVIGVGWGAHYFQEGDAEPPQTFDDYLKGAQTVWSDSQFRPVRWLHDASVGSLVWFRDLTGSYYLARITGGWQLLTGSEAERIDLGNIRAVAYRQIGSAAEVPGGLLRAYAAPRQPAFGRVRDYGTQVYSALLASEFFDTPRPEVSLTTRNVLDSLLGPLDVEDLVAVYLQDTRNYVTLPARYSKSTAVYEYVLKSRDDGHRAVVQVKTGNALVPTATLDRKTADRWFAYVAADQDLPAWVERVTADDLVDYMDKGAPALPPVVERWMEIAH